MAETVSELLARLLDRHYETAAKRILKAVTAELSSRALSQARANFDAEVARLYGEGKPLARDNPALVAYTALIDAHMRAAAGEIENGAEAITRAALEAAEALQTALPLAMGQSPAVMARWNVVSANALAQVVDFTSDQAWADHLMQFRKAPTYMIDDIVIKGFAAGWNPLRVAEKIASAVTHLPRTQANVITRTLFLQSYRRATTESYRENRRIISKVIRLATLDNRVCPVCAALHGTEIPLDEPVEAHYQCRCTSIAQIEGAELPIGPTGEEWFEGLPADEQERMLGPGVYSRYLDGRIGLSDLVGRKQDPLYGTMLYERALWELDGLPSPLRGPVLRWDESVLGETRRMLVEPAREAELNRLAKAWERKSLTQAQRDALSYYTQSGYFDINGFLRTGVSSDPYDELAAAHLMDALTRPDAVRIDDVIWRGRSWTQWESQDYQDFIAKHVPGSVHTTEAFWSSTIDPAKAFATGAHSVMFEIYGSTKYYIGEASANPDEREAIVPPGVKYRVLEARKIKTHIGITVTERWFIIIEEVN